MPPEGIILSRLPKQEPLEGITLFGLWDNPILKEGAPHGDNPTLRKGALMNLEQDGLGMVSPI